MLLLTVVLEASAASSVVAESIVALPAPIVIPSAVANFVASSTAPVAVVTFSVPAEVIPLRSWFV